MEAERLFLAHLTDLLLGLVLAGLVVNGRARLCWSFAGYVAAVLICDRLIVWWPESFYTRGFWAMKESLYWLLKLGVAAEIGLLTFAALPRARRILIGLLSLVLLAAALAQLAPAAERPGDAYAWAGVVGPRGQAGMVCLLASVVVIAVYYRVPLHPLHRSIVIGLALYLVAYTSVLATLREIGARAYLIMNVLDPVAYAATVGLWARASWRSEEEPGRAVRWLRPWARP